MITWKYNEEIAREVEREEAIEEGIEKGRAEGIIQGIQGTIQAFRSMNIADISILQQLQQQFGLTEAKAKEYMNMF